MATPTPVTKGDKGKWKLQHKGLAGTVPRQDRF